MAGKVSVAHTGVLFGQIVAVCMVAGMCMWVGTQWTAAALGYSPRLGPPVGYVGGLPLYYPWQLFIWWYVYEAYAPSVFMRGGIITSMGGVLGAGTAVAMSVYRARQAKSVTTYGSACWAEKQDIEQAGLLRPAGVFLGQLGGHAPAYLRHDGPEHVMAIAPTRSGKGVGLVVPTLLTWPASCVVHDIKGENWMLTAGWRSRFSHCLYFNPTSLHSAAYNPLLEVRRGMNEVRDVQNIADILVDPEGMLERRSHWEKTAHSLLVGTILHVLYAEPDKTLRGVAACLSNPARSFEATLRIMLQTRHMEDGPHLVVTSAAREVLNKSENERSGVLSTAMSFLGLYRDPTVATVTERCDWRIADLISADSPISLYLVVPPSDISRTKPLVRLLLNQIGRRLTESLDGSDGIVRLRDLLLMLDEFAALGRLDFFESALAYMAAYRLRAYLIAQSLNQIEKSYGANNSILDNCHVRVVFSSNDERTAKRISDSLGTATELRAQRNYGGHRLAPWLGHLMVSRQETARPLRTPGEIMQLPDTDQIVMVSGHPPILAKKLRYYEDGNFSQRILCPPQPSSVGYVDRPAARPDDWSGLALPPLLAPTCTAVTSLDGEGSLQSQSELSMPAGATSLDSDSALINEDEDLPLPMESERRLQRAARLVAVDPDDGIPL